MASSLHCRPKLMRLDGASARITLSACQPRGYAAARNWPAKLPVFLGKRISLLLQSKAASCCGYLSRLGLSACVLNVFAGSPQSIVCFASGVGIRFQEIDGPLKGHGFPARGTSARIGDRLGLHAGHIPF